MTGRRFDLEVPISILFISLVFYFLMMGWWGSATEPYLCKGRLAEAEGAQAAAQRKVPLEVPHLHNCVLISWKEKEIYLSLH